MTTKRHHDQAEPISQQMGRGSVFSFDSRLHLGKVQEEIEILRVGRNVVNWYF